MFSVLAYLLTALVWIGLGYGLGRLGAAKRVRALAEESRAKGREHRALADAISDRAAALREASPPAPDHEGAYRAESPGEPEAPHLTQEDVRTYHREDRTRHEYEMAAAKLEAAARDLEERWWPGV
jgi:hypothetical protein